VLLGGSRQLDGALVVANMDMGWDGHFLSWEMQNMSNQDAVPLANVPYLDPPGPRGVWRKKRKTGTQIEEEYSLFL
jgi:hypothetical protein